MEEYRENPDEHQGEPDTFTVQKEGLHYDTIVREGTPISDMDDRFLPSPRQENR